MWVTSGEGDSVLRIDPSSGEVVQTIQVGVQPVGIVEYDGLLYVANSGESSISRIDPATGNFAGDSFPVEGQPTELAVGEGGLWVIDAENGRAQQIYA